MKRGSALWAALLLGAAEALNKYCCCNQAVATNQTWLGDSASELDTGRAVGFERDGVAVACGSEYAPRGVDGAGHVEHGHATAILGRQHTP